MKTNIRKGVWETNSSSSHSIVIDNTTNDLVLGTILVNHDGNVELTGGEFGWEWEKTNNATTKANYLTVALKMLKERKKSDTSDIDFNKMLTKIKKEYDKIMAKFIKVIKYQTGCKEVVFSIYTDYNNENWSYIDHQSIDNLKSPVIKILMSSEKEIRNFIFNKRVWLCLGNDNEPAPPNYYDVGNIKYTHALKLGGTTQIFKFQKSPTEKEIKDVLWTLVSRNIYYKYGNNNGDYEYCPNKNNTNNSIKFSSFDKFDLGKIILFKTECIYDKGNYFGEKILAQKELKFKIIKL